VTCALVVRARVDDERADALCLERLFRFEPLEPVPRPLEQLVDRRSRHLR